MWNYRIVKEPTPDGDWFEIKEVYYRDGKPFGYSAAFVGSDTLEHCKEILERFHRALSEPVINADDISENAFSIENKE